MWEAVGEAEQAASGERGQVGFFRHVLFCLNFLASKVQPGWWVDSDTEASSSEKRERVVTFPL